MIDIENTISNLETNIRCIESEECHKFPGWGNVTMAMRDALELLKEQPQIVLCKDCVHRGKVEKCVLAAIAAEKSYPLFMLDNRGEWFCADGERSVK